MNQFEKRNAKEQVQGDLTRAKNQAIEAGARGVLSLSSDGTVYSFGLDYLPLSTASPPAVDEVVYTRNLPTRVTVTTSQDLLYNTRGMVVNSSGALTTTTVTLQYRSETFMTITVYPTGAFEVS